MIILGRDRELARWAGDRLGIDNFGLCITIGVARNDEIVAVAVYNNWRPPNIEITFVTSTPRWASRENIRLILGYPFLQLGCKRISAMTAIDNDKAQAFLQRLGFKPEGFHPDALPSGDAVSYGLLWPQAQRWIRDH